MIVHYELKVMIHSPFSTCFPPKDNLKTLWNEALLFLAQELIMLTWGI